ncbi:MAG: nuclear transport factor 2 family protein [Novosphingobium sp.]
MADDFALVREWLEVLPEGRFDEFPGQIAEDFVLRLPFPPPGVPAEFSGRDHVQTVMQKTAQGRGPLVFHDVQTLRTEDPHLFVTTCKGEALMNNGKTYRNSYVILTRIENGVLLEHIEYLNPLAVMESWD